MQQNMGSADSFIRVLVGIAFLVNIIILEPGPMGIIVLLLLGMICLATAWIKYCHAYKMFNVNTCAYLKTEKSE
jgi:F0F1-type ATP synthase assembly protein I